MSDAVLNKFNAGLTIVPWRMRRRVLISAPVGLNPTALRGPSCMGTRLVKLKRREPETDPWENVA